MKNVVIAWCNTNEKDFENFVPLKFVGERNLKLSFSNDINILFFNGFNNLSQQYKSDLQNLGYSLFDVSDLYNFFDKKYSELNRFGNYEKKCFLRWPVLEKFFQNEQVIHYDGDIIFNEDPLVIAKKLKGKTFVLQGCPAFTCISNIDWFSQYNEELNLFVKDIENYSDKAWRDRFGWEITFKTRWAGSRFRKIITSDQDFISHLIHSEKIIQDKIEDILLALNDYICFENPLFVHSYDENFSYKYIRENGIDYFSYKREDAKNYFIKKRVLFWHMQSCFNFYLSKAIFRKKFLSFLPMGKLKFNLAAKGLEDFVNKKAGKFLNHNSRLNVYKYFFEKHDFSGVFNKRIWWKEGIFD
ncbi:hypothetical protein GF322_01630 [Candidatus Dependentiae bacterium]|nr:hypothetical protein [Candidatus Dependentiae bacterium]